MIKIDISKLDTKDQRMVDLHVNDGYDKVEAYVLAHDVYDEDLSYKEIKKKALYRFRKPIVKEYHNELFKAVVDASAKKATWTKELSAYYQMEALEVFHNDVLAGSYSQAAVKGHEAATKALDELFGLKADKNVNLAVDQQVVIIDDLDD